MRIERGAPLANGDEQDVRERTISRVESDPEPLLAEYSKLFGNLLNADNAATLFEEYNEDPAKYRVAVHPAAQWIRDELFRRALDEKAPEGRNRIAFTAGGNAAGKSTAIEFSGERDMAQAILDSTFANLDHARSLIDRALPAGKRVSILYVYRPLEDALLGMLERAEREGRLVTIDWLVKSQRGAAETVRELWTEFGRDARYQFRFIDNSSERPHLGIIELTAPRDYTGARDALHELLDAEYRLGPILFT